MNDMVMPEVEMVIEVVVILANLADPEEVLLSGDIHYCGLATSCG